MRHPTDLCCFAIWRLPERAARRETGWGSECGGTRSIHTPTPTPLASLATLPTRGRVSSRTAQEPVAPIRHSRYPCSRTHIVHRLGLGGQR